MIGVCIVTYNQEQYIAQAIESVLMQEPCGHDVVVYIGEDCSTDSTGAICDEFANRVKREKHKDKSVKIIHNPKNLGLVGNTMILLDIIRKDECDYIAMLDGDDYWPDSKKLQKQMAYMEAHPEYGLVHTYVDVLFPDGKHKAEENGRQEGDVFNIIENYQIGNCSVMFRTELLKLIDFEEFQKQGLKSCDYVMYAIFASKWKFGFIPEHTAVWRRGIESVSGTADMEKQIWYVENDLAHWRYLAKLFPQRWTYTEEEGERYLHMCSFNIAYRFGNRQRALQEERQMTHEDRKRYRLKIACLKSSVTFHLYRIIKRVMHKN